MKKYYVKLQLNIIKIINSKKNELENSKEYDEGDFGEALIF